MKKSEKGITLIALVLTIIILIVLSTIVLNFLIGDNGLITQAKMGKEIAERAEEEENQKIANLTVYIDEMLGEIGQKQEAEIPILSGGRALFGENVENFTDVRYQDSAWAFTDTSMFSNSIISRIDTPIKSVDNLTDPYFTVYVVDTDFDNINPISETKVYIPIEQLGDSKTVNSWVSITGLNIVVGENQTLAFGKNGDTAKLACTTNYNDSYNFVDRILLEGEHREYTEYNLIFDIYKKEGVIVSPTLRNKSVSILGDSISTYEGITDDASLGLGGHQAWYNSSNIASYGMNGVNDTWWMQTINNNGMNLVINNSWGGAYVIDGRTADGETTSDPQNSGMIRAQYLETDSKPDIIAVFMGTNDIIKVGDDPGVFDRTVYENTGTEITSSTVFVDAYSVMMKRLISFYPNSKIFLFTLMPNGRINNDWAKLDKYNNVIRDIANYSTSDNIYLVDLYNSDGSTVMNTSNYTNYLSTDIIHPNSLGMDYITIQFENAVKKAYNIMY